MTLHDRVIQLVEKHGSLRAAARAIEVDAGYLSRLGSGEKESPSPDVLRRMGLRQVVTYELCRPAKKRAGGLTECDMGDSYE
jgi:hypothetical protein